MSYLSGLSFYIDGNGNRYLAGDIFLGSKYAQYSGQNLEYYNDRLEDWVTVGGIDRNGNIQTTAIYVGEQLSVDWRINPERIRLGSSDIATVGSSVPNHSSYSNVNGRSYSTKDNPFARYFNGVGFGLLIILQVIASPIWLLAFIRHPILVTAKVFRTLISATLVFFMLYAMLTWDLLMLTGFVISFGLIRTESMVITGYTKELYSWITCGGEFWDLE